MDDNFPMVDQVKGLKGTVLNRTCHSTIGPLKV